MTIIAGIVCIILLILVVALISYRAGKMAGFSESEEKNAQRIEEVTKELSTTLYNSVDDPNAGLRVRKKPKATMR